MRILFRVGIGMVHAMHYSVSTRVEERGTLKKPSAEVENPFNQWRCVIHLV